MEMSESSILDMIELYKNRALLWNPAHKNYFRRDLKQDAWDEISGVMGLSVDDCKRKMQSLLSSYRRENLKIKRHQTHLRGESYDSRWFAYDAFKFMEGRPTHYLRKKEPMSSTEKDEITFVDMNEMVGTEDDAGLFCEVNISKESQQEKRASSSFVVPSKRVKYDDHSSMLDTTSNIPAFKLDVGAPRDEFDSFFAFVVAKVRKYSPDVQQSVQHAVMDALMRADKGLLGTPTVAPTHQSNNQPTDQSNHQQTNQPNHEPTDHKNFWKSQQ
ncbi:uncharacterized protein LOC120351020 [Nilaparvata lugens]|uniref:uncharacterized protein LOC120351020 n=1 Tax=Nilaparvata lugens TaxID=108931 RepID=UPI00193E5D1B|nr:uncharacterized protein LOC120351020 [Nilaparvata lugens]